MVTLTSYDFVPITAVIMTVLQFLSGVLVCEGYMNKRTTGDASAIPFISTILSCSLWLLYGIVKDVFSVIVVNIIGVCLMSAYTVVFYTLTIKKNLVLKQLCLVMVLILLAVGYTFLQPDKKSVENNLGLLSCAMTLFTVISPMNKLFHVIKVKNTECLPYPMILMSFFVTFFWCLYGIIINDTYLQTANFLGAGLALSQLFLFVLYPKKSPELLLLPLKGIPSRKTPEAMYRG